MDATGETTMNAQGQMDTSVVSIASALEKAAADCDDGERQLRPATHVQDESRMMSDEDVRKNSGGFFDAHESLDSESSQHSDGHVGRAQSTAGRLRGSATTNKLAHAVAMVVDAEAGGDARFVVRNQDTGEEYDIRDASQQSIASYSIFPSYIGPSVSQSETISDEDMSKRKTPKARRPSISKLKIKLHLKGKGKELSKQNFVPVSSSKKDTRDFEGLSVAQSITRHTGTIWTMKFSHDGARLVSGGQDAILRIWKVALCAGDGTTQEETNVEDGEKVLLEKEPEQSYHGHTMPIVDASWSRSNFILSASMDKTVRLWHISREDCLHIFQHPDSVPAVDFHPKEDRYFLSGCFDNKARVWDIPEGCVVSYVQTPAMITAASFNPSGNRVIVGLLNGQCIFYQVNSHHQMNYYTQIECRNNRGPMKKGRKVTGIEFDPEGKFFLVSTNDSRMRLFSVDNYSRICKYKGLTNDHLQIKGRFSQDGDFVICGSENGHVYIWNRSSSWKSSNLLKSNKVGRNASYEYFCAAEPPSGIVTVALFAPASTLAMVKSKLAVGDDMQSNPCTGLVVTASYDGCIKCFERSQALKTS